MSMGAWVNFNQQITNRVIITKRAEATRNIQEMKITMWIRSKQMRALLAAYYPLRNHFGQQI